MTMLMDNAIFSSVFPAAAALHHTTPTPVATPDLAFTGPGSSFGALTSPNSHRHSQSLSAAQVHVKRNIAWSAATRFLSLTNLTGDELKTAFKHGKPQRAKSREADEAIAFLLSGNGPQGETDADWNLVSNFKWNQSCISAIKADRNRSSGTLWRLEVISLSRYLLRCKKLGQRYVARHGLCHELKLNR
jgi:hypothetical protein